MLWRNRMQALMKKYSAGDVPIIVILLGWANQRNIEQGICSNCTGRCGATAKGTVINIGLNVGSGIASQQPLFWSSEPLLDLTNRRILTCWHVITCTWCNKRTCSGYSGLVLGFHSICSKVVLCGYEIFSGWCNGIDTRNVYYQPLSSYVYGEQKVGMM